ncbi:oxygen-independent coproporphyrinogen III oxidase [Mycobacterium sp. KBS0706]|uniref:oxygen-independent coproporphyrinogen III oxidase n=1 Tax=Mycobacterium sp. KBS0706 TaxID=2578109 RepID=UPI00110FF801|nr:oxygen-independent coproporphyrinogen III oxidase [Mycobacterium sp. KBS0706]TSD84638.1 oxygen-independent coproporphyrinogen III oxidase [Mycobacterium sp. KBS0706]
MTWSDTPPVSAPDLDPALLGLLDERVPRYTSYPTAAQFGPLVGAVAYRRWLAELPDLPLSLYLHIPFCRQLCWYCGCATTVVRRSEPVEAYLDLLRREIAMVAATIGRRQQVAHVHFGGGTPNILSAAQFDRMMAVLRKAFDCDGAEIAVEIDPRVLTDDLVDAFGRAGVARASIGVQDFAPAVQAAINRVQSVEQTRSAVERLRAAGVAGINLDLVYGLPYQTEKGFVETVEAALALTPDRLALFGYAHVPWMRRHQTLIDESALPGGLARWRQYRAAGDRIADAGFRRIGLDHFARPYDTLADALDAGRLRRNFQGYTADDAPILLGFGASAIGQLPQGYVQNPAGVPAYGDALKAGRLPTVRGIVLTDDDRLRGAIIERLMCDLAVDVEAICRDHDADWRCLAHELAALAPFEAAGIVMRRGPVVRVAEAGRLLLRSIASVFDVHRAAGARRYARAV